MDETIQNQENKPSRLRYIIAVVALLLILTPVFVFMMLRSGYDPASEKIIREIAGIQLQKDPNSLTDDDFANITELSFTKLQKYEGNMPVTYYSFELSDIKFLEKFTNLKKLDLSGVILPSSKIPIWIIIVDKFSNYNLWGRYSNEGRFEIDLSPLKKLPDLKELYLFGPFFSNIKPLANTKNLEYLYLRRCYNITKMEEEDLKKAKPNLKIERVK